MIIAAADRCFNGSVDAPASKSVYHRELIVRFLCGDRDNLQPDRTDNDDVRATKACLSALASAVAGEEVRLPCNESGSTLRFMIPVAASFLNGQGRDMGCRIVCETEGRLFDRPVKELADALKPQGVTIDLDEKSRTFIVTGTMMPGEYEIDGSVSSQYISGLIMALPLFENDCKLRVRGQMKSVHYIGLTQDVMAKYGCVIPLKDDTFIIKGGAYSTKPSKGFTVEGDWSNGAFLLCIKKALALRGRELTVNNLNYDSRQGDKAILDFLALTESGINEIRFDCSDIPDIAPYMAVTSAFIFEKAVFSGIARLRIKESDRVMAVREQLKAFGIMTEEEQDSLTIYAYKGDAPERIKLSSYHDHRMAMCAILLAVFTGKEIDLDDIECVNKSFPELREIIEKEIKQ